MRVEGLGALSVIDLGKNLVGGGVGSKGVEQEVGGGAAGGRGGGGGVCLITVRVTESDKGRVFQVLHQSWSNY